MIETSGKQAITIEKLVYGGEGLGRLDGQAVLVPYVLPGEEILTQTTRVKTGLLRGMAPEIVISSRERVPAPCPYFGRCGGCQYQHAEYKFQLAQKSEILRETLRRLGGISYENEIPAISGPPWAYRNRVQLHFANGQAGFHQAGSRKLCAIDGCPISSPLLSDVIGRIARAAKQPQWPKFLRSLELFTNGTDLQLNVLDATQPVAARFFEWCRTFLPEMVPGAIDYQAVGHTFHISGQSFFQVNRFLIDALVEEVSGDASGERAVDLYAGVGLFSLALAKRFSQVVAVERGGSASRDLSSNVVAVGEQITAIRSSAEAYLRTMESASPIDLLVVDPPRAGLGRETTDLLMQTRPRAITVVSCDPATLGRDLRKLAEGYEIARIALVDLFPQTAHFETVVKLIRK